MTRIWITGFRKQELGIFGENDPKVAVIKYAIRRQLQRRIEDGATWLITGGQQGVEQWALEVALELQSELYPDFQIALMTPFKNFGSQWQEASREKLTQLQAQVTFSDAVSQLDYQNPTQLKQYQAFMLAHTDEAVLIYDDQVEGSKARYDAELAREHARHNDYMVKLVDFDELQDAATEMQEARWEDA